MANTLIKNAPTGRGSGNGNGSGGGSGGGSTGSGTGGSSCQQAQNAAVAQLFPGYTGAGSGSGSNGGVQITGPNGDVWRIASPSGGSCSNGYVKVEYEMLGYRLRSG